MQDTREVIRYKRLAIFSSVWLLLGAQALFAMTIQEPYPAIVMPAFPGTANKDGERAFTDIEIEYTYTDGTRVQPSQYELMNEFRFSSVPSSLEYMFRPIEGKNSSGRPMDESVLNWLRARGVNIGHGKKPIEISFCWRQNLVDIRQGHVKEIGECESSRVPL